MQSGNFPNIRSSVDWWFFIWVLCPVSWVIFFISVLGWKMFLPGTHGSDIILIAYGLFRSTKVDLPVATWSQRGPYLQFWNNSFLHELTPKLINYYLKLKFSNSLVPPSTSPRKIIAMTVNIPIVVCSSQSTFMNLANVPHLAQFTLLLGEPSELQHSALL